MSIFKKKKLTVRHGDIELRDPDKHFYSALTTGINDITLIGSHKETVKWLVRQNLPVRCSRGYGNTIFVIIRNQAPRLSEQILKSVADAFGISPMSLVSAGFSLPSVELSGVLSGLSDRQSDIEDQGKSKIDEAITNKCTSKDVIVTITSAKGCHRDSGIMSNTVVQLPSGLSSRFCGGALAALQP